MLLTTLILFYHRILAPRGHSSTEPNPHSTRGCFNVTNMALLLGRRSPDIYLLFLRRFGLIPPLYHHVNFPPIVARSYRWRPQIKQTWIYTTRGSFHIIMTNHSPPVVENIFKKSVLDICPVLPPASIIWINMNLHNMND